MKPSRDGGFLVWLAKALGLAVAYFVTGRLGLLLAIPPGYATAVWPPSGIALAGILIFGYRLWPGILLGSFLVNVGVAFDGSSTAAIFRSLAVAASIGTGAALQAVAGAALVRRAVGYPTALDDERDVGKFLVLGGPVSSLVNATWSVTTLFAAGTISVKDFPFSWWTWWVGDTIGILTVTPLVLVWIAEPRENWRPRRASMTVPLCVTFALAVAFFVRASAWEQDRIRRGFVQQAVLFGDLLRTSVNRYLEVLRSVHDFHEASSSFTWPEFRAFVERPLSHNPGISALSWNARVLDSDRAGQEAGLRREGRASLGITERAADGALVRAARRDEYVFVRYIEPYEENGSALGYDVSSDPTRRHALARARDSGQPFATARVQLIQDPSRGAGVLVLLPVYRKGQPRETVEERRVSLEGYVVGVLRVADLVAASVKDLNHAEVEVRLDDESAPLGERLLYSNRRPAHDGEGGGARATDSGINWHTPIEVAGRRWMLRISSTAQYLAAHRSWQAWTFLAAALLFTSLLGAFLLVITGRTTRVEMLVEQRTGELAGANRSLMDEVALRKQSELTLQEKNVELAKASQAKDRFLATMSHELRTPLNAVIGFTGTLLMKLPGPLTPDQEKQLRTVDASAKHLLSLINDLLDLAKIESGKVEVLREPVVCQQVVDEVATTLRPLAEGKGLRFEVVQPPDRLIVRTDRRVLSQILINLVTNAIKYTDHGEVRIELREHRDDGRMRPEISVTDTGAGIAAEDQANLFRAFTRLEKPSRRGREGTGLGLYLSGKLAELIGARIALQSEVGKGSVFTLVLAEG